MLRDIQVRLRVNAAEHSALAMLAKIERRKPSEMLRETLRREAVKAGVWLAAIDQANAQYQVGGQIDG